MGKIFRGIPTPVYIDTEVMSDRNGNIIPLSVIWNNSRRFQIEKIYRIITSKLPQGGEALCYECRIQGKRKELYLQDGKWFVLIDREM